MATIEQEALVSLTEGAATKIRELMAGEPAGEAEVLRIAVQGGGCRSSRVSRRDRRTRTASRSAST